MESQTPSVRTCVVKVEIKCCTGCQSVAKRKLQRLSGVSRVEYSAGEGLMTVSGEVNPNTLVTKIQRWGKAAQLVSVQNHSLVAQPGGGEVEEEEEITSTCSLLRRFFRIKSSKAKAQPSTSLAPVRDNRNWQFPVKNGRAWGPFPPPLQPAVYHPQLQAMHGPLPYPDMAMGQPPPSSLHFQSMQRLPPQMVNPTVHYPRF